MGAGRSQPISFDGGKFLEGTSITVGALALAASLATVGFIVSKSGPNAVAGLTENSFLSKTSELGVALLVAYLPIALLWLGPLLSVLLLKSYFMIPTAGSIITFFLVGALDKIIFKL